MLLPSLLAQGPTYQPLDFREETVVMLFVAITLIWLVLCWLVLRYFTRGDSRLLALGIVTAAAAVGYTSFVGPAGLLLRVAMILVLGGVAYALLAIIRDPLGATTTVAGEPIFTRKERTDV